MRCAGRRAPAYTRRVIAPGPHRTPRRRSTGPILLAIGIAACVLLPAGDALAQRERIESAASPALDGWKPFRSEGCGLEMHLPGEPEVDDESVELDGARRLVTVQTLDASGASWMVRCMHGTTEEVFDKAREALLQSMAGKLTLVDEQSVEVDGRPGVELRFDQQGHPVRVRLLRGPLAVVLQVAQSDDPAATTRFFDSVRFSR